MMEDTEVALPVMTYTRIGALEYGIDGTDIYLLVTSNEDDITPAQAVEYLMPLYYSRSSYPGGSFCTMISAVQVQYRSNQVIATVHQRYDN